MATWCGGLGMMWGWSWRAQTSWRMGYRRRGGLRGRVGTLFLCLLLLLALHILLSDLDHAPYPTHAKREKRTGFAPRQEQEHVEPCQLYPHETNSALYNSTKPVTKVLLLTYMQAGGSFLLGQLFDKSENITFWSEPVDGILSDMYGTLHGWHPLDVFTNEDGLPRYVPSCEEKAIVQHLSALYSCNLGKVPVDILTTPDAILPSQRTRHYMPCLQEILADVSPHNSPSRISSNAALVCKELLVKYCPKGPYSASTMNCYKQIQSLKSEMLSFLEKLTERGGEGGPAWADYDGEDVFHLYGKCMASLQYHSRKCLPLYTATCNNSDTVVVKSTRLRGEQVAGLMDKHPDLKVIHFVRDPRGVALSREKSRKLSEVSELNYINEAVLLCQRMHYDLAHLALLKHRYPDRLLTLQYEQFMQDPENAAQNVFSFLQKPIPSEVRDWLNTKMEQLRETGPDGRTMLRNMTKYAFRWRRQIPNSDNRHIVRKCADVLKSLNYSPMH